MVSILFRSSLQDLHPQPNLDIFTLVFRFLCITIQSPCSFLRDQFIFQPNLSFLLVSIFFLSFLIFSFLPSFRHFIPLYLPFYLLLVFSLFFVSLPVFSFFYFLSFFVFFLLKIFYFLLSLKIFFLKHPTFQEYLLFFSSIYFFTL